MNCIICNRHPKPSANNPNLYNGFRCQDTGHFVHWNCREEFYRKKHGGEFGAQHAHKYSEVPVVIRQHTGQLELIS